MDFFPPPQISAFWSPKLGPIGCLETSVRNYHYLLCNKPEGRGSLGVCKVYVMRFAYMMYFLSCKLKHRNMLSMK